MKYGKRSMTKELGKLYNGILTTNESSNESSWKFESYKPTKLDYETSSRKSDNRYFFRMKLKYIINIQMPRARKI